MNGWSIKAEYLYVDLGRASTTSTNLTSGNFASLAWPTNVFTHTVNLTRISAGSASTTSSAILTDFFPNSPGNSRPRHHPGLFAGQMSVPGSGAGADLTGGMSAPPLPDIGAAEHL